MKCLGCSRKTRLVIMIVLTLGFFFAEIVCGELSHSNALKADAFHMLSDVLALFIAFVSVYVSPRNWSKNTYGFARAEVLGALTNAVFLIALSFTIFTESLKRFIRPEPVESPDLVIAVGCAGLGINIVGLLLFHEHAHSHGGSQGHSHGGAGGSGIAASSLEEGSVGASHHGHSHGGEIGVKKAKANHHKHITSSSVDDAGASSLSIFSTDVPSSRLDTSKSANMFGNVKRMQMNIRGVFLHIMADALGSVIVIVSAVVIKMSPDSEYKDYIDPSLSMILVILIVCATWPLLKDSAYILLQTVPSYMEISEVSDLLLNEVPEIEQIHEFHVWQLVASRVVASVHVKMGRNVSKMNHMKYAERIKRFFHNMGIHWTTVQVEYKDVDSKANKKGCYVPCPEGDAVTDCSEGPIDKSDLETKPSAQVTQGPAFSEGSQVLQLT